MPRLGIGGKTMAPEMGAMRCMGGHLAVLADDGVVGGLGTAAPVPHPARLHKVMHSWLLPGGLGAFCPSGVAIPLPGVKLLGIELQPLLGVNGNTS